MPMQMHMLGAMWAPTNELTLMGMLPFLQMEMNHLARVGTEFTTESAGIGDVRIVGLYTVARPDRQRLIVQFGASMPTGSIDEKDVTPASAPNNARLPYPMQVGSGTFDLLPGVTYLGQTNEWSWGAQATATVRLGKNDNEYRFGNEGQVTAWGARRLSNAFGVSGRILGSIVSDVVDADPDLNPMMVPTAAAELQSGGRIDSGLGINAVVPSGQLHGLRVALELLVPLYQDVDGPQLGLDPYVIVGVQYAFDL